MTLGRAIRLFFAVVLAVVAFAIYEATHHSNHSSVTLCTDETLPGGDPIPVCNPTTTYTPPGPPPTDPPASRSVPTTKGYSSQGWTVVAGSVTPMDSAWDGATMVVKNAHHTAQTADFDVYIYQSVILAGSTSPVYSFVCDMEGQTNGLVGPGTSSTIQLSSTGNLDEPDTIPQATYNYVFTVDSN
ncbi:MAG: hypothetical protein WAM97_07370 [Acidimicrobiales bacterium]|jgi:hypothetical protein